ncbi:hypothetical protein OAX31_03320 [Acidimicrobiia bacterium]|nr:hypothetical protein [Acidimicrobiia bacterium]
MEQISRFGGNVLKITNGNQKSLTEFKEIMGVGNVDTNNPLRPNT